MLVFAEGLSGREQSMDPSFLKFSSEPIYNMKAVSQRTGIPAPTLRAWERSFIEAMPEYIAPRLHSRVILFRIN